MKRNQILLIALGVVLLVAGLTNPNETQHKAALRAKLSAVFQGPLDRMSEKKGDGFEGLGTAIGLALGGAMLDRIVESLVSVDNYLLFSLTRLHADGQSRILGFGAFGNVFISSTVDEALQEAIKEQKSGL